METRVQLDEDAAFERALTAERTGLAAFLRRRLGEDALVDDAVQETLLRAWQRRRHFDSSRRLGPWLLTLGAHVSEDLRRREILRRTEPLDAEAEGPDRRPPPLGIATDRETLERLETALERLGADARNVFLAFYRHGRSIAQIAEELGMEGTTVKSHLHRTRRRLAERLGDER